jgi:hypothetical protein
MPFPMRPLALLTVIICTASPALAANCSERAGACQGACTPELVASGQQAGGTIAGCRASCTSRLRQCLRSGLWVHMGAQRRGMQEQVERR